MQIIKMVRIYHIQFISLFKFSKSGLDNNYLFCEVIPTTKIVLR